MRKNKYEFWIQRKKTSLKLAIIYSTLKSLQASFRFTFINSPEFYTGHIFESLESRSSRDFVNVLNTFLFLPGLQFL